MPDLRATIYPTLWQPMMIKGIPRDWMLASLMASTVAMVGAGMFGLPWYQFYGLGSMALMSAIGWLAAKFDPEFYSITLVRARIGRTRGGKGGNEYLA